MGLHLFFLEVGQDVGGRLDLEVKIFQCVRFDVLYRKQLEDLLVLLRLQHVLAHLPSALFLEDSEGVGRLLLLEGRVEELGGALEVSQVSDPEEAQYLVFQFGVVEHVLEFQVVQVDDLSVFDGVRIPDHCLVLTLNLDQCRS